MRDFKVSARLLARNDWGILIIVFNHDGDVAREGVGLIDRVQLYQTATFNSSPAWKTGGVKLMDLHQGKRAA